MGWKCCVPLCRSGYKATKSSPTVPEQVSFHAFPHDSNMKNKWLRAIKRVDKDKSGNLQDYVPTPSSRVCSLHFHSNDFVRESKDTNVTRTVKRQKVELKIVKLKPSAIPRIFENYPSYLTSASPIPDFTPSKATASARLEKEEAKLKELESEFLEKDKINGFEALCQRLMSSIVLPTFFSFFMSSECVLFCCISDDSVDKDSVPSSRCFVRIYKDMTFDCFVKSCRLNSKIFSHLLKVEAKISSETELTNVLAKCKSLSASNDECDLNLLIEGAHALLERFITLAECDGNYLNALAMVKFIAEQLSLCQISEYGRRYTPNLLVTAFLWHMTGRSLCSRLNDLFFLYLVCGDYSKYMPVRHLGLPHRLLTWNI